MIEGLKDYTKYEKRVDVTIRCQYTSTAPYLYVRARPCVDIPHRLGMVCPGVRPDSNSPLLSQCNIWRSVTRASRQLPPTVTVLNPHSAHISSTLETTRHTATSKCTGDGVSWDGTWREMRLTQGKDRSPECNVRIGASLWCNLREDEYNFCSWHTLLCNSNSFSAQPLSPR